MSHRNTLTSSGAALAALCIAGCGVFAPEDSASAAESPTEPAPAAEPEEHSTALDAPEDDDQAPPNYSGPRIDTPEVPTCPHHEEVSQEVDFSAQLNRALELGCEPDIHGTIEFAEPIEEDEYGATYALISTSHALSVQQMCDEGYISEEDCAGGNQLELLH